MGDFITESKIENRQKRARKIKEVHKNDSIEFFTKSHSAGKKNKMISARVSENIYNQFRAICEARGTTANAQLNVLICDYVMEYKHYIDR